MINNHTRPWKQAALWLLFLGPFFFITYNFANGYASQQEQVGHIVFAWEQHIPFVPWTIVPYWVIDILYVVSLFICTTKAEVNTHGKRLLSAQIIAVTCFILFPLGFSFTRPETGGVFGDLFILLASFDQPFNQAPSLHIALLAILWVLYIKHLPKLLLWPFHALCIAIGVSVLTTYQHHFIDIPTGLLLGVFCIWLWPDDGDFMLKPIKQAYAKRRWRLAGFYLLGAASLTLLAALIGGTALWLLWVAIALLLVAYIYGFIGSNGFQKNTNGHISLASKCLLLPYLIGAKINAYLWTAKINPVDEIADNIWLGRFPSDNTVKEFNTVIDLTAEFSAPAHDNNIHWHSLPTLDLITPSEAILQTAVALVKQYQPQGPVLINCALGYSRSALVIVAWLLITKREATIEAAIARVKLKRPTIVFKESDKKILKNLIEQQ